MTLEQKYHDTPIPLSSTNRDGKDYLPATHYPVTLHETEKVIREDLPAIVESTASQLLNSLNLDELLNIDSTTKTWGQIIGPSILTQATSGQFGVSTEGSADLLLKYGRYIKAEKDPASNIQLEKLDRLIHPAWQPIVIEPGLLKLIPRNIAMALNETRKADTSDVVDLFDQYAEKELREAFHGTNTNYDPKLRVACLGASISRGIILTTTLNYNLLKQSISHHISFTDTSGRQRPSKDVIDEFYEASTRL